MCYEPALSSLAASTATAEGTPVDVTDRMAPRIDELEAAMLDNPPEPMAFDDMQISEGSFFLTDESTVQEIVDRTADLARGLLSTLDPHVFAAFAAVIASYEVSLTEQGLVTPQSMAAWSIEHSEATGQFPSSIQAGLVAALLEDLGITPDHDDLDEEENELLAGMENEPTMAVDLGEDPDSQEPVG